MLSKSIKKVIIATLVALVMGTSIVLPSSLMVPISVEAAVINAQSGNLTVTASSLWAYCSANWSNKTRTFTKGTSLTVLEKHSVDGREMYKLSNGLYISANPAYVSFKANGSAPVPAPAPSQSSTMTTTQNLNLRRGATTSHGIILTISKGAQVQIISMSGEWANVNYQGKVGYVSSQYLSGSIVTTPTPAPTPTPTPPVQLPSSGSQMRETTANLNMRNGASTSSKIMLTIPRGSSVTILSESAGWAKVSYAGKEGHVSSTYLKSTVATQEPTAPPAVETPSSSDERKTTQNLNMRNGAGTGNAVLLTIPKGSLVSVLSESDGWAKLSFGGKVGYASTSYLEKVAATPSTPAPEPTPVPTPNPEPTPPAEVIPEPTPTPQPQPGPGESVNGKDMRIITGSLYMRSGADDNASIITILSQGTIVEVESLDGKWAKITHEGVPGYASTKFMSPYSGTTPEVPSEKPPVVGEDIRENTFNLNMRKGPGTEHAVLVTIPQGTLLTITEIDGYWAKVTYNGQTGYVSTDYLIKVTYPSTGGQDDSGLQGKLDGIDAVNYNNEDILVSGFAKIASGVKEVKVYLNSKVQGTATYGINRADDGNSLTGYRYTIKRNNLFPGENKILVVVSGNEGERFTYTKTIQVNKVPLIVIDPGHGGKDSGAAGFLYGMKVYEKTYVLQFAAALNEALSSSGFNTIMTRNNDRFIELSDRARMADNNHADLLFSLHHDYNGNSDTKGAFVIYPSYKSSSISQSTVDESKDVADYVKNSLMDLGFVNRRNGTDQSISGHSLAVLRQSQTRSILAEMGYMSNAEDLSKISDPVFQKAMANNLTKQLKAYFKMN